MTANRKNIFHREISSVQCKDGGMALVLIFLIIGFVLKDDRTFMLSLKKEWFFVAAIIVLVLNMIWSGFLRPWAWFWYSFAELLGNIVSKIILTVVFFTIVTPVGFLRKFMKKDRLHLRAFKKDTSSVLIQRDHLFNKEDIEQQF